MEEGREERETSMGRETILLVEDEEMLRELVQTVLEMSGFNILTAEDGEGAVSLYKEKHRQIDLVLSDLELPGIGGWEACRQMLSINPNVKIVIATGYLDSDAKEDMIRGGVRDFVNKPYLATELTSRLRKIMDANAETGA